ncbi:hypothetical protein GC102_30715 [Paenibacillus sp. LMG 31460]|uniref:Uncharacterized protein n=1 Tax=Paenibacillus germinis TaxID=2654979 RepID=A0ABX1Z9Q3_9BACL|nr:hypothetical protein [Paenibacillus germinis]
MLYPWKNRRYKERLPYVWKNQARANCRFLKALLTPQSFIRLGRLRHSEAIKAEASLGIPRSHLFFLSFPDGGTLQIAQSPTPEKVFRSRRTLLSLASYPFSFVRNAPYSKINLANDTHPDHNIKCFRTKGKKRRHFD